ncbi:MAG: RNA polymerase subunit sigma-24 [Fimbriimonadales bacterium]|nr:MAG: RNA polymerase subunit sigma-24 [Fimbriimonadales bacterium]
MTKRSEEPKTLVERLSSGDGEAIEDFFNLYYERIFKYTYRMLNNPADAEDATQETFIRALRRCGDVRSDNALTHWLFRIAHNLCVDKRRQQPLVELPPDLPIGQSEDRAATRLSVRQALMELPADYVDPLILCDVQEVTANEAAEILGISVPALKSRLYRGRSALRQRLSSVIGQQGEEQEKKKKKRRKSK